MTEVLAHYPVAKAIQERRTIKSYKTDPVDIELLQELLDIAVWAPNHKLREPWRFIAFVNEGRRTLAHLLYRQSEKGKAGAGMNKAKLATWLSVPAYLIVVMPENPHPKAWQEDYAAVSTMIQNFQLAAWERGLGANWKTGDVIYTPEFRQAVGVQPGEKIVGLFHIGYPAALPKAQPRTPAVDRLTVIDDATVSAQQDAFPILVSADNVFMNLPAMTKSEAIQFAGEKLHALGYVDEAYISSMHEQEKASSTYLCNGVCAPHGSLSMSKSVSRSGVVILHFPDGIDYENGETVYLMIAVAAEQMYQSDILNKATAMFAHKEHAQAVAGAGTVESFLQLFAEAERIV